MLLQKLLFQANRRKHLLGRILGNITWFLMLACLLEVGTLRGALQRDLPLLPTTLRADAVVHGEAKALFFALITDRTTHAEHLWGQSWGVETLLLWHLRARAVAKTRMDVAFSSAPVEKTA